MWVARDKYGELYLYRKKPTKRKEWGIWDNGRADYLLLENTFPNIFPDVKWSDDEPTEIILKK